MSRISKYNQISTKRPPHRKRSIRIQGSGEDDGKWFRCWYCGFINNIDRNSVGQGEGISYNIGVIQNDLKMQESGRAVTGIGDDGEFVLTYTRYYPFIEKHNVGAFANSGCSFCGSLNYR